MGLVVPDTGLLFWMLLSFGVTFWLLVKFAWKPILKMIKNREDSIQKAFDEAKEAKKEADYIREENKKFLFEARLERENLLKLAHETKEKMIRAAETEAKERALKIITEAKIQIETEKNLAIQEIKSKVAELTIDISEKILRKELADKQSHISYINTLVNEIDFRN